MHLVVRTRQCSLMSVPGKVLVEPGGLNLFQSEATAQTLLLVVLDGRASVDMGMDMANIIHSFVYINRLIHTPLLAVHDYRASEYRSGWHTIKHVTPGRNIVADG